VWRTNHAYDPQMLAESTRTHPDGDSLTRFVPTRPFPPPGLFSSHTSYPRYFLLHDTLVQYGTSGMVGILQAINLTAIVGDKGGSDRASFLSCAHAADGENILSVTFDPAALQIHAAFEEGRGAAHMPACCNNYVRISLAQFFSKTV
jgi:hypothetical protein